MKVLINTPDLNLPGGVANHYKGLENFWSFDVKYNSIGGRKRIPGIFILPIDFIVFFMKCLFGKFDAIVLNPSLGKTALLRDFVFLRIANLFKIEAIFFIHGWDLNHFAKLNLKPQKISSKMNKASSVIVLAKCFKNNLIEMGVTVPIYVASTKVDDNLLEGFEVEKKELSKTILFLARIEANKGIYIAMDAFKIIQDKFPDWNLLVAGSGSELINAQNYAKNSSIQNINFLGNISGIELKQTLSNSTIYILPTTHGEGMPTSILEAMAFGMPVISRPVGGVPDFFVEGKMGTLIDSTKSEDFANCLITLVQDLEKTRNIGVYNHNFATKHFLASIVAKKIESIISRSIEKQ